MTVTEYREKITSGEIKNLDDLCWIMGWDIQHTNEEYRILYDLMRDRQR